MARTKQSLLDEAARIEKLLDSGKIKGKTSAKKFRMKMHNLRWRASKKSDVKVPKLKAPKLQKGQGFLPNFLAQMDVVRVEEILAERLSKAIDKKVNQLVDEAFSKIPRNKVR